MFPEILGGFVLLIAITFGFIGFLFLTRGVHIRRVRGAGRADGTPSVDEPFFPDTVSLLTRTSMLPGHRVDITTCGDETYPQLWKDLRSARRSITAQLYYCQPGKMADEFKAILCDRARAGVQVLFLADAFGAQPLPGAYYEELKAAGVEVRMFRPRRWFELHKMQNRSHIRVIVVDGSIAWTGGFGLDDKWYGDGRTPGEWRDTNVRFEGPAALQHQGTFAAAWAEAAETLLTGDVFFPPHEQAADGDVLAGILHAAPTIGSTNAERFVALSIAAARRTLYISNAYFVPSEEQCRMLGEAAKRGVDVRVLTCGREEADVKSTYFAGRRRYEQLLASGVRLYEYQPAMMHAKTMVVDGMFAAVGTMNFDNRSMAHNDETMLLMCDARAGARLDAIFREDLAQALEIDLATFRNRPFLDRVLERGYNLIWRLL